MVLSRAAENTVVSLNDGEEGQQSKVSKRDDEFAAMAKAESARAIAKAVWKSRAKKAGRDPIAFKHDPKQQKRVANAAKQLARADIALSDIKQRVAATKRAQASVNKILKKVKIKEALQIAEIKASGRSANEENKALKAKLKQLQSKKAINERNNEINNLHIEMKLQHSLEGQRLAALALGQTKAKWEAAKTALTKSHTEVSNVKAQMATSKKVQDALSAAAAKLAKLQQQAKKQAASASQVQDAQRRVNKLSAVLEAANLKGMQKQLEKSKIEERKFTVKKEVLKDALAMRQNLLQEKQTEVLKQKSHKNEEKHLTETVKDLMKTRAQQQKKIKALSDADLFMQKGSQDKAAARKINMELERLGLEKDKLLILP